LEDVAAARDNALEVWERLIELARQAEDWEAVLGYCQRALAVQPLRSTFQLAYAEAAERLQRDTDQMAAYRALLALEPSDPAELYYRLARAYQRRGRLAEARRSVLQALEEAPGFRAAQDLLWELTHDHSTPPATHPSATPENVPRP
jgi:tetratricopeptide (TPR) repeat protein